MGSSTEDGVGGAAELEEAALRAFAVAVEVNGAGGDGQLAAELGNMGGEEGWRLSLVRLVERDRIPEIQAGCVVLEARAKRGKVFRMRALAVQEELRAGTGAGSRSKQEIAGRAGVGGWTRD